MKELLDLYKSYSDHVIKLEKNKQDLELANIDLDSKETMTKLTSKLLKDNDEYSEVCNNLSHSKNMLSIIDKRISFGKAMIPLFKDYTAYEAWVSENIVYKDLV